MEKKDKNYTEEFKKQIVALNNSCKSAGTIAKEYDVARYTISKWISDYSNTGSFKANDW